jgi:hypothetical protein
VDGQRCRGCLKAKAEGERVTRPAFATSRETPQLGFEADWDFA